MGIIDQTLLFNMSTSKFITFICGIFVGQITCFFITGFIAPHPSNTELALTGKCTQNASNDDWYLPWGGNDDKPINCKPVYEKDIHDQVVFAAKMPLRRNGIERQYSRWNQNMIAALYLDIIQKTGSQNYTTSKYPNLTIVIKLGSRNKEDPVSKWTLIANETQQRQIRCNGNSITLVEGSLYDCEELLLFELSSVSYDYYLINIFISELDNEIGQLEDVWIAIKVGNEKFIKTWLYLKTAFFPIIIVVAVCFRCYISKAERSPIAFERMLLCLCAALTFLNLPLEFVILLTDVHYISLLTKLREIIFYGVLFGYWLWFHGYYLMIKEQNRMKGHWIFIAVIIFICTCHLIFDIYIRSFDLQNAFNSIWISTDGANWGLVLNLIFAICSFLYLMSSFYFVCHSTCYFGKKLCEINQQCSEQALHKGIFYRFIVLSAATILCSVITVMSYIIKQVTDGYWKWNHYQLDYSGIVYIGAYAMWNFYILILLVLYLTSNTSSSFTGQDALLSETETPTLDVATEL